jgi:hypothetical protein
MVGKPAILPQPVHAYISQLGVILYFPGKCEGIFRVTVALALRW